MKIHDLKRLEKVKAGMKLEDVKVRFAPYTPVLEREDKRMEAAGGLQMPVSGDMHAQQPDD